MRSGDRASAAGAPVPATHHPVPGSRRSLAPGGRRIGRTAPDRNIEVVLKLRRKAPLPELDDRPASALGREALAAAYGAADADIERVTAILAGFGLERRSADAATRTVRLAGAAAAVERAFAVELHDVAHVDGDHRGHEGEAHVPAALAGLVVAVFGLDTRKVALRRRRARRNRTGTGLAVPPGCWLPAELAARYAFPPGDGAGQTVALLEFGGGYFPHDLALFCRLAGTPVPKPVIVSTDGTLTALHDGDESEVMLDIEILAGLCPAAGIVVYFADWTEQGWITALDAVLQDATHDPAVLSISWGNAEDTDIWSGQAMAQLEEALKEAAWRGISVCVAAGDDGSSDAVADGRAHVDYPGSSAYALSVGGTGIPDRAGPDIVWHQGSGVRADHGGSTGGGVSAAIPRPAWQHAVAIAPLEPGAPAGRCVPDVAANADWDASPYLLVVDGHAEANGGTSAAAPLWAALLTRINAARGPGRRIGWLTPLLYRPLPGGSQPLGALACTDVVSGSNASEPHGGFTATPGYDAASGWGTPKGTTLLELLSDI